MNLKGSAYKIKLQTNALYKLLEGMESVDWTDEIPMGVTIFLKHIINDIDRLYNALPGKVYYPVLPGDLTAPPPSGASNNRKLRKTAQGAKQSRGRKHGKK